MILICINLTEVRCGLSLFHRSIIYTGLASF
ncbi:hypothetical protein X945_5467 [Burkholderia pseudomallei ABCPW 107]|nr:hypothetical protein X945_5467 [Burkholderia pseudomallei ABCPW 107]